VLHKLKTGDEAGAVDAARRVTEITGQVGGNRFWSQIVRWWTQAADDQADMTIDWLDGEEAARSRWMEVRISDADPAIEILRVLCSRWRQLA
jgi:hypothetical protein